MILFETGNIPQFAPIAKMRKSTSHTDTQYLCDTFYYVSEQTDNDQKTI